jgi:hypothetical protein
MRRQGDIADRRPSNTPGSVCSLISNDLSIKLVVRPFWQPQHHRWRSRQLSRRLITLIFAAEVEAAIRAKQTNQYLKSLAESGLPEVSA